MLARESNDTDRSQVPLIIYHQINTLDPLAMRRWGATHLVAGEMFLMFFVKTSMPKTKMIVEYQPYPDSYKLTLSRIADGYFWEVLDEKEDIYCDQLVEIIDLMIKTNL
ncbi:MAG: hypothetical protein ACFFKA_17735 [Candidatus Thorarchaeota archaeon]